MFFLSMITSLNITSRLSDCQTYSLPQQRRYSITNLNQLLILRPLKDKIIRERLKSGHFTCGQNSRQLRVYINPTMIFLYCTRRFIPRTLFPSVRIAFVQTLPFGASFHSCFHIRLMFCRDMVERLILRMVHQIRNRLTGGDIFIWCQQCFRMIISLSFPSPLFLTPQRY